MTTAKEIRSWLMCAPRPTSVRLQQADGQVHELACTGQPWARLGESCAAIDAVTIFALDAQGKMIRVAKVADIAGELDEYGDDESCSSSSGSNSSGSSSSAVLEQHARMQRDDNRAMLATLDRFGTLLADAYRHATETAFARMVSVVQLQSEANVAMQRELMNARVEVRRMERDMFDDMMERAEERAEEAGEGDVFRQFMGAYFQGHASKMAAAATDRVAPAAAKPNGQKPPPPKGA